MFHLIFIFSTLENYILGLDYKLNIQKCKIKKLKIGFVKDLKWRRALLQTFYVRVYFFEYKYLHRLALTATVYHVGNSLQQRWQSPRVCFSHTVPHTAAHVNKLDCVSQRAFATIILYQSKALARQNIQLIIILR